MLATGGAEIEPLRPAVTAEVVAPSQFRAGHFTLTSEAWTGREAGASLKHNESALGVDSGVANGDPVAFDPHESWSFRLDQPGLLMGIEFEEFTTDDADKALLRIGNHRPILITADSVRGGYWRPPRPLSFAPGQPIQIDALEANAEDLTAAREASGKLGPISPGLGPNPV